MLSFANTKLKRDGIASFSIPAGSTCPNKGACVKGCYAMQGFFLMPSVKEALRRNYEATKNYPKFIKAMDAEIKKKKPKIIRIHASGDFYSVGYFNSWICIAAMNPKVRFYAYTKMVGMVKATLSIPKNLTLVFSYGGTEDHLINPLTDRHSHVFSSFEEMEAEGYKDTTTNDINALGRSKKIGLVYHGAKKRSFDTVWPEF